MEFDGALINALHDNGRLPVSELARRLEQPRRRVQERMRELLDSGAMRITANVHPALLGIHTYCDVQIWVDGAAEPVLDALRGIREATFISAVAGHCDLVVEVGAEDRSHLELLLARIRAIPGVRETASSQLVQIFKSRFEDATDLGTAPAPDAIDARIIALLREDGRLSYRVLGREVELSIGAVRARLARLMQNGMLRIACEVKEQDAARRIQLGAGIRLRGETTQLIETLRSMPAIKFAALAVGQFDAIVTASAPSLRAMRSVADEIRELECVSTVTSWVHLDVLRESYE
ncbi:AsnC family transcriptional regulator [Microterricola gilva]|uniref:AsnC family transcriptional regulator n=1 Tax=Microterricola gilva TaxID=393267 RepID=A0A4V2GAS1_9MICO|nr:Lrp/AsnC family transcriptional regulator [Microterricola gilva]RZU65396.1 AsnC family transcriptional regulator [Microterricola gilva]